LWIYGRCGLGGPIIFFRLTLCDESLGNMMNTNFTMMQNYQYSLSDIENLIPWEKTIYVSLLVKHIAEENERIKRQNQR
jgi:hypothetical protein